MELTRRRETIGQSDCFTAKELNFIGQAGGDAQYIVGKGIKGLGEACRLGSEGRNMSLSLGS